MLIQVLIPIVSQATDVSGVSEGDITLNVELKRDETNPNQINITATDSEYNITALKYVHKYIETSNASYFEEDHDDIYTFDITPSQSIHESFELDGYGSYTVYAKNEAGWDWPSHVIQLHPVYPCEVLNLHSDSIALQLARNTLYYYSVSQIGFTETMNELGLSAFVMGARIGFYPELLVENLKTLIRGAGRNFLITDGHHCLEKTAAVETINSMMLQSIDGVLHLFPCWLKSPASFTRLRAKGAFIVSAKYDGESVISLQIKSEKGNLCKLKNPWPGERVSVNENGCEIDVSFVGDICSFETEEGKMYEICKKINFR